MPKKMQNSFMKTAEIHLILNNGFKTMEFGHDFSKNHLIDGAFKNQTLIINRCTVTKEDSI